MFASYQTIRLSNLIQWMLLSMLLLAVPQLCRAENTTTWTMTNQQKLDGWNSNNLTNVQLLPQGLTVTTQTRGELVGVSKLRHRVDTISFTYISPTGADGLFFWRPPSMEEGNVFQIPITFTASPTTQTLVLDISKISEWDHRSDRIGFVLNAGSQLILQEMSFSGPSGTDVIVYPFKTFFTFDQARAYSINFLWGPLMTYSEQQFNRLFALMPPHATSWNWVFYGILAIGLVVTCIQRSSPRARSRLFLLIAIVWVIYDLRMGAELISYAHTDVKTWWSKPIELKDFRDRKSFTAFAQTAAPFTEGKDRYVFLASHGWPFWGSMKYATFPARPIAPDGDTEGVDTWIFYKRNDVTQNEDRRLVLNGTPISPPGDIMLRFEPGAFVFVTDP